MLKPLGKRILAKPVEVKHGTLIVSNQKPVQFQVVAIGDEVTKVKAGDTIYIEKHYGVEIEHDKERYSVLEEMCILAKVD